MDWTPPPDGIESCHGGGVINPPREEASMEQVSIIGIDLAKNSFQLHGARADGSVAFRKKLSPAKLVDFLAAQPCCVVAMEACASAHYWGRETEKLGHEIKLVPPIYVKPFVKRHKLDGAAPRAKRGRAAGRSAVGSGATAKRKGRRGEARRPELREDCDCGEGARTECRPCPPSASRRRPSSRVPRRRSCRCPCPRTGRGRRGPE